MFKREIDLFKKMIVPASNQRYLSTPKKHYEKFGKTIEHSIDNPFRALDGQYINDYFVLFEKGKPEILFSEKLMQLGEWQDYGSKLYRINTINSAKEVKLLLISELTIDSKNVLVTSVITGYNHESS